MSEGPINTYERWVAFLMSVMAVSMSAHEASVDAPANRDAMLSLENEAKSMEEVLAQFKIFWDKDGATALPASIESQIDALILEGSPITADLSLLTISHKLSSHFNENWARSGKKGVATLEQDLRENKLKFETLFEKANR